MTKAKKEKYEGQERLRDILTKNLNGRKFRLDCGHHVTFGHFLGNNITIYNGKKLKVICSECGY
jgi:spermidine/putrescine-binding protein